MYHDHLLVKGASHRRSGKAYDLDSEGVVINFKGVSPQMGW